MLPQAICFQFGIHLLTRNATGWNNAGRERLAATLSALYVPAEATAAPIRHPGPGWKDRGSATCGTALPTLRARLANARLLCQARGDTQHTAPTALSELVLACNVPLLLVWLT